MRLAGFDKDINSLASKDEFLIQAKEYKSMVKDSKWDKTMEFLILKDSSHPLMTVRALECEEWAKTDQFINILNGSYEMEHTETLAEIADINSKTTEEETAKKTKSKFEFPKMKKKRKEEEQDSEQVLSAPDEIRQYKALLDEGIITEEEFTAKKKQLLGL